MVVTAPPPVSHLQPWPPCPGGDPGSGAGWPGECARNFIGLWFFGDRRLLGLDNKLIDACVICDAYKEDSVHII